MNRFPRGISASKIRYLVGDTPTMLEIGCHDGTDTVRFLQKMPGARIYCFDPELRATKRFKERLDGDARVTLYEVAIADIDGEREFYASTGKAGRMDDWDYSGSLCKPTGHYTRSPEIGFKDSSPILCTRLDTWYAAHTNIYKIDFIWADVQGSQRLLIEGGKYALSLTDWLYIESHDPPAYAGEPTQEELIDELSDVFQPIDFYAENILFKNRNHNE